MKFQTASQIVNFAIRIEEKSEKLYEKLVEEYPQEKEIFSTLLKENRKNKLWIQRAYNEIVSDALETGFSFEGVSADKSLAEDSMNEGSSDSVLEGVLEREERIQKFYQDTAEKSKAFLADLPRVFERIAKKQDNRKKIIRSLSGR